MNAICNAPKPGLELQPDDYKRKIDTQRQNAENWQSMFYQTA